MKVKNYKLEIVDPYCIGLLLKSPFYKSDPIFTSYGIYILNIMNDLDLRCSKDFRFRQVFNPDQVTQPSKGNLSMLLGAFYRDIPVLLAPIQV